MVSWLTEDEPVKHQMVKWAQNCGTAINHSSWEFLWRSTMKLVIPVHIKENMIKMQFRWHITLKKLSLMNKNMSNKCWKCGEMEGSYYHMWWMCTKAKGYWDQIHRELCKILGYKFEKRTEIYLISIGLEHFIKEDRTLICYAIGAARLIYAQKWRVADIPTTEEWLIKLYNFMDLDCLTRTLKHQNSVPQKKSMEN